MADETAEERGVKAAGRATAESSELFMDVSWTAGVRETAEGALYLAMGPRFLVQRWWQAESALAVDDTGAFGRELQ